MIELDQEERLWVSAADGSILEEAWRGGAGETPNTFDRQEIAGQLGIEVCK